MGQFSVKKLELPGSVLSGNQQPRRCAAKIAYLPSSRHAFPGVFSQTNDSQAPYGIGVIGDGLSSAIMRRMSARASVWVSIGGRP